MPLKYIISVFFSVIILSNFINQKSAYAFEIISDWISTTSLNTQYTNNQSLTYNGKIYLFGGTSTAGASRRNTLSNTINNNGSLNSWIFQAPMLRALIFHSAVLRNNRIYIIGGMEEPPATSINNISYTDIDSSGNITSWHDVDSSNFLPERLALGTSVIINDWIYYFGGVTWSQPNYQTTISDDIYVSKIDNNGSIGIWSNAKDPSNSTIKLPTPLAAHGIIVNQNRIYIIGGSTDASFFPTNKIYVFESDPISGNLTRLPDENDLQFKSRSAMIIKVNNYVIHAGGVINSGYATDEVYINSIDNYGNMGSWTLSSHKLNKINCCAAISHWDNYIYVLGGHDALEPYYNSVIYSKINLILQPQPILFIPGMGASWNADALLNCRDENYSGNWELAPYAEDIYMPLLQTLNDSEHDLIPYYYDWRKDVRDHSNSLSNILQSQSSKYYVVGHSMGGLLARAYLERTKEDSNLDKLMTIGTPHKGSVLAYPAWSAGEVWNDNFLERIAMTILLKRCSEDSSRVALREHIPSAQNLLPIFDYLNNKKQKIEIKYVEQDAKNNWLPNSNILPPFYGVEVGTLSGYGIDTLQKLDVKNANKKDEENGDWKDGFPTKRYMTISGDGTVLNSSSNLEDANYHETINKNHSDLVRSSEGISKILEFLEISETPASSSYIPADTALVLLSPDADIKFYSEENSRSAKGISVIISPKNKIYKFITNSKKDNATIIVVQFLKNNVTFWKEYKINKGLRNGFLKFNQPIPQENILEWY